MVITEPEVPYQVLVTGVICQSPVTIYDQIWFTHSSELTLVHQFNHTVFKKLQCSFSLQCQHPLLKHLKSLPQHVIQMTQAQLLWYGSLFQLMFLISKSILDQSSMRCYFTLNTNVLKLMQYMLSLCQDHLVRTVVVSTGAASSRQTDVDRLDVCTEYWLVARAATCAAEEFSDPFKVELLNVTDFGFSFELDSSTIPHCEDWVNTMYEENINIVENGMKNTLNSTLCGFIQASCFSGSIFTCNSERPDAVYFR